MNKLFKFNFICHYIDPGTGGVVFGSIGPFLAAAAGFLLAFFAIFRQQFKFMFFRIWRFKWLIFILLIIISIATYFFLKPSKKNNMHYKKILVVGIDGLDPDICRELLQAGKMPNLQALISKGTFKDLKIINPAQSPVSWSCLACGVNPGKHGIFDFIHRDPKTYLPRLSICSPGALGTTSMKNDLKAEPFWNYTSKAGIPTTIIRWPVTFPPERITGDMLSGLGVPDICGMLNSYRFFTTHPKNWKSNKNLQKIVLVKNTFSGKIPGPKKSFGKSSDIEFTGEISKDNSSVSFQIQNTNFVVKQGEFSSFINLEYKVGLLKKVKAICTVYVSKIPNIENKSLEIYFSSPEIDPREPALQITSPEDFSKSLSKEIGTFHTLGIAEDINAAKVGHLPLDAFFEQCKTVDSERMKMLEYELEKFSEGVLAVVFDTSDRWQHIGWRGSALTPGKENQGAIIDEYYEIYADKIFGKIREAIDKDTALIVFSDHGFTSFERAFNMNNWLVENGYMTIKGELCEKDSALFKKVDWSRTKAYCLGFCDIYLNIKGREKSGIVDEKDASALKTEIIGRLKQFIDSGTKIAPIHEIYDANQIYFGEYQKDGPDLVIGFKPGYRMGWQTAIGGLADKICETENSEWKGDHLVDASFVSGTFLVNFPVISKEPRTLDIAPTILDLSGLSIPADMDGVSLWEKECGVQ